HAGRYWNEYVGTNAEITPNLVVRFHNMSAAATYFLRSEGALNGWNMLWTAQALYEEGVKLSKKSWGTNDMGNIQAYLNSSVQPIAPGDYHSSPAVATTPVKWDADPEVQRAQIGTQKWLAIFPDGMEAWAEFRRSGFPKMYDLLSSERSE